MARDLRQNTATRVGVGPFLDATDGVTPETGLTVTNDKITFIVDSAGVPTLVIDASATASGGNNDMVHITGDDAGFYDLELTAAQTNYVGRGILSITDATNHVPVFHEFNLLPADVYDAKYAGSYTSAAAIADAVLDEAMSGHTTQGTLGELLQSMRALTAQAGGTSTQLILDAGASAIDDFYNGCLAKIVAGTGAGQRRWITDYTGSSKIAVVDSAWVTNPDATSKVVVL